MASTTKSSLRSPRALRADFYNLAKLKERGWTPKLIQQLLGNPDETRANPKYASASPTKLYRCQRVETAESTPEFSTASKELAKRREAAAKGVDTKRRALDQYVNGLEIEVPSLSDEELIRRACQDFNSSPRRNGDGTFASENSDRGFLDRICVNYLRHCLTRYETELANIAGKVGKDDAYLELKDKVLDAIGDAYPALQEECWRQSVEAHKSG